METGYYIQSRNKLTPTEPWTDVFSVSSSRTLRKAEETFDFLNARLGSDFDLRIVYINVTPVKEN